MIEKYQFASQDVAVRSANIAKIDTSIQQIAQIQNTPAALIKAIIAVESSGNPLAGQNARTGGAKGLMQIIDQTWRSTIQNILKANPNAGYKGQSLNNFLDREVNAAWSDPMLNMYIGTSALQQKAQALTRLIKRPVSLADANCILLILTSYNAGEGTVRNAYNFAVAGGSANPLMDFIEPAYMKQAIQQNGWDVEKKYKEISEYASKVVTFWEHFGGTPFATSSSTPVQQQPPVQQPPVQQPPVQETPPVQTPPVQETTNLVSGGTGGTGNTYTVASGDSGFGIAKKLGVAFSDLQKANPGVDWNKLSIGQVLNY